MVMIPRLLAAFVASVFLLGAVSGAGPSWADEEVREPVSETRPAPQPEPKMWHLREAFIEDYRISKDPRSKMMPDDRGRYDRIGNRSVDVILWTLGEPFHGTAHWKYPRVISQEERTAIEDVHVIEWSSSVFPMAVLHGAGSQTIRDVADLSVVYLVEIEEAPFRLFDLDEGGYDPRPEVEDDQ